jgi:hypothetical protein
MRELGVYLVECDLPCNSISFDLVLIFQATPIRFQYGIIATESGSSG